MNLANTELRASAKRAKVPFWAIARKLCISEPTMTRKLRDELSDSEKNEILAIIEEIAKEKEAAANENANN